MAQIPAPNTGAGSSLYFLTNIDTLRDPVRNTRWRMLIPGSIWAATGVNPTNGENFLGEESGADNYALHIKSCQIPSIKTQSASLYWMGFESKFPVNQEGLAGEMPVEAIMLEDMRAYEAMVAWNQNILNTGILSGDNITADPIAASGIKLGLGVHKDTSDENTRKNVIRNSTVKIELYNWMRGERILEIVLHNAWPKSVDGAQLTYQQAQLVNFKFNLSYDRWSMRVPTGYKSGPT